jgi:hypothetical protein
MDRFRYLVRQDQLKVGNYSLTTEDNSIWRAPLEVVAHASLASFRNAIRALAKNYDYSISDLSLMVSSAPESEFDEDYSIYEPVKITALDDGKIVLDIMVELHGIHVDESDLRPLLAPLLTRSHATFVGAEIEGAGTQAYCEISVAFERRGAVVQEAIEIGLDVVALIERLRKGAYTADSALELLIAGRADLMVGLPESSWLEVKSQGYDLQTDHGRIELAQDIARFANGDTGSLLVIGMRTRKTEAGEVITKTSPALQPFDIGRYHRSIDSKLFPPIQGLIIRNASAPIPGGRSGNILAIYIPTQPEEMKPFLVHGAIVRGKVEGAFISIVQRRSEHSIPITAPAIHATLAAGRALLRRNEVPPPTGIQA